MTVTNEGVGVGVGAMVGGNGVGGGVGGDAGVSEGSVADDFGSDGFVSGVGVSSSPAVNVARAAACVANAAASVASAATSGGIVGGAVFEPHPEATKGANINAKMSVRVCFRFVMVWLLSDGELVGGKNRRPK